MAGPRAWPWVKDMAPEAQAALLSNLLCEVLKIGVRSRNWVGVDLGRFQTESECKCWFHLHTGLVGIGDGHCVGLFP